MRRAPLIAIALLASAGTAHAATWSVTTTTDSQDGACTPSICSLRDAVAAAGPGDIVAIPSSSSHYVLALGQIQIAAPITVQGAGPAQTVIDAQSRSRIFEITSGVGATGTVTFDGLTLTHGGVTGQNGGAVLGDEGSGKEVFTKATLSDNSVTVNGSTERGNGGGAIYDLGADLSITESTLSGNSVTANGNDNGLNGGGAIWYCPTPRALLSIHRSTLRANTVVANGNRNGGGANGGGAIQNVCGDVVLNGTTLTRNSVTANDDRTGLNGPADNGGGALWNDSDGTIQLEGATVANNTATVHGADEGVDGGGGILFVVGLLVLDNSTIAGNTADVAGAQDYEGGGGVLGSNSAGLEVLSSTISGNRARFTGPAGRFSGGGAVLEQGRQSATYLDSTIASNSTSVPAGLANGGGGLNVDDVAQLTNVTLARNGSTRATAGGLAVGLDGRVQLRSSIVAGNTSGSGAGNCVATPGSHAGVIVSLGYNLEQGGICTSPLATDILDGNPRLGALRDNGGETRTLALLPHSAAIDAIPQAACVGQGPTPQPITTDQRGMPRGDNGDRRCDIGAYESQVPHAPVGLAPPRIAGTAAVGSTLTALRGRWAHAPTVFVHRWLRCDAHGGGCRVIRGAPGAHYTLRRADVGHRLRVREVAVNAGGSTGRNSAPTAVVTG